MTTKFVDEQSALTNNFYNRAAPEFSKTRQASWKGWKDVVTTLKTHFRDSRAVSLLDLGCGNGRLYEYLINEELPFTLSYTGVDSNSTFLAEAARKWGPTLFKTGDIVKGLHQIENNFDVIAAFGVTHHIPGEEFRRTWFVELAKLVKPKGILVFSNWNFPSTKAVRQLKERGDFLLPFGTDKTALRYCHTYSAEEMQTLNCKLNKGGLTLINSFTSDGRDTKSNTYYIYERHKRKC